MNETYTVNYDKHVTATILLQTALIDTFPNTTPTANLTQPSVPIYITLFYGTYAITRIALNTSNPQTSEEYAISSTALLKICERVCSRKRIGP